MGFVRIFIWATTSLGLALGLTFALAWMMRPSVVPDDVDAIRMVAVAASGPHRLPVEFRLENTGSCPALVATDNSYQGVMFRLDIFDPDGRRVRPPYGCAVLCDGPPVLTMLKPGLRSEPLEYGHPLSHWQPRRPGRYRFVATYRYIPFDVRWQGLPILSRWCEVNSAKHAAEIRRTRAFTRTMDFEIDLP